MNGLVTNRRENKRVLWALMLTGLFVVLSHAARIEYAYDDAGRLTNAAYDGGANIAYVYDANGNLLLRTVTAAGETSYTLVYLAGAGGQIVGVATQKVAEGGSGTPVEAAGTDSSVAFGAWSDGSTANPRTDADVTSDLTVVAGFESSGGAALDWYADHGFTPESGELWSDLDHRTVADKNTTLLREFIADTNPNDTGDVFRALSVSNGPPLSVRFQPGSTGRIYTLQFSDDLLNGGAWSNVPGAGPRPGLGGVDAMSDGNAPPTRRNYRIQVEVP